ncbi:hypothetical protein WN51_03122 [Melipona quadrifasciata]|uniref:Uncharacterized protein n=1 Tax=Melipona quadrifasciata TaxID=166423 RepID=A0A0N1ITD4_9HYME|nr:hypothetical protein WN51_03122 [Melipona quadrifasciata]
MDSKNSSDTSVVRLEFPLPENFTCPLCYLNDKVNIPRLRAVYQNHGDLIQHLKYRHPLPRPDMGERRRRIVPYMGVGNGRYPLKMHPRTGAGEAPGANGCHGGSNDNEEHPSDHDKDGGVEDTIHPNKRTTAATASLDHVLPGHNFDDNDDDDEAAGLPSAMPTPEEEDHVAQQSLPSSLRTRVTTRPGTTRLLTTATTERRTTRLSLAFRRETSGPPSPDNVLNLDLPPSSTARVTAGTRRSPGSAPTSPGIASTILPRSPRFFGPAVSNASPPGKPDTARIKTKRATTVRRAPVISDSKSSTNSDEDFAPSKILPSKHKKIVATVTMRGRGDTKTTTASRVATNTARTTRAMSVHRHVTRGPPSPTAPPSRKCASPKRTARAAAISRVSSGSAATPQEPSGRASSGRASTGRATTSARSGAKSTIAPTTSSATKLRAAHAAPSMKTVKAASTRTGSATPPVTQRQTQGAGSGTTTRNSPPSDFQTLASRKDVIPGGKEIFG